MLTQALLQARSQAALQLRRNYGASGVLLAKAKVAADPIQQLFLNKINDYAAKSKASGGGLVDVTPAAEARLAADLAKIDAAYKAGPGFLTLPKFEFAEPVIEEPGVNVVVEAPKAPAAATVQDFNMEEANKLPWH